MDANDGQSESEAKVLIMGPGRCGSTFLFYLLKELGLDTGPHPEFLRWERTVEKLNRKEKVEFPTIIKHLGGFCLNLNDHIDRFGWSIKHIFFCLRRFEACLNSRVGMTMRRTRKSREEATEIMMDEIPHTVGMGLFNLIERDHPFTVIRFPRSAQDPEYCYNKLSPILEDIDFETFKIAWEKTVDPSLILHGG